MSNTFRRLLGLLGAIGIPLVVLVFLGASVSPEARQDTQAKSSTYTSVSDTATVGLFKRECASCHGEDGKGKTRAGRRAGTKDFTDPEYQASWTNEEALDVILTAKKKGEQLKNKKPYSDKLTKEQIRKLIEHVREFTPE